MLWFIVLISDIENAPHISLGKLSQWITLAILIEVREALNWNWSFHLWLVNHSALYAVFHRDKGIKSGIGYDNNHKMCSF
jgi:hypothetical protein